MTISMHEPLYMAILIGLTWFIVIFFRTEITIEGLDLEWLKHTYSLSKKDCSLFFKLTRELKDEAE